MGAPPDPVALRDALAGVSDVELAPGACCAALYENPGVRWVLGGDLHPGGPRTTRRALELAGLAPGELLVDIGCGSGESALLAAEELGARVTGVDLSEAQLAAARAASEARGLGRRAGFVRADANDLPLADESVDVVLMECVLSTIPGRESAAAEIARVLRPGGRVAVSDVVVDAERLPPPLRGPLATLACIGSALDAGGYERLLARAGLELIAREPLDEEAARLAERVEDRLRGARVLGFDEVDAALDLVRLARAAIAEGSLGYGLFVAARDTP